MKVKVISLSGATGAGKDEASSILIAELSKKGIAAQQLSFSGTLYEEISKAFGVSVAFLQDRGTKEKPLARLTLSQCQDENFIVVALPYLSTLRGEKITIDTPISPREMLKTWGNGYRRESQHGHSNYFANEITKKIQNGSSDVYIVSDTRQFNEFDALPTYETVFLRINRSDIQEDDESIIRNGHPSDANWRTFDFDDVIENPYGDFDGYKARLMASLSFFLRENIRLAQEANKTHQSNCIRPSNTLRATMSF